LEVMTFKEVCDFLKISKNTLISLIKCYDFPHIRLKKRGKCLFRKESILNWIEHKGLPLPINSDLKGIRFLIKRKELINKMR